MHPVGAFPRHAPLTDGRSVGRLNWEAWVLYAMLFLCNPHFMAIAGCTGGSLERYLVLLSGSEESFMVWQSCGASLDPAQSDSKRSGTPAQST